LILSIIDGISDGKKGVRIVEKQDLPVVGEQLR
jgi:hypothetical protein